MLLLPDEILLLCFRTLQFQDLCTCSAVSHRLHGLTTLNILWRPLALWIPGLGCALSTPCPIESWKNVVGLWTQLRSLETAKASHSDARRQLNDVLNRSRSVATELRHQIQRVESCKRTHILAEKERDRLLSAHALWRMESGGGHAWGLVRPRSPPSADQLETANTVLHRTEASLILAKQGAAAAKCGAHQLADERGQIQQKVHAAHAREHRYLDTPFLHSEKWMATRTDITGVSLGTWSSLAMLPASSGKSSN